MTTMPAERNHRNDRRLKNYYILLAEDDLLTAEAICKFLEEFNINVTHARDGEEALGLFRRQPYDLVISDFEMPKISGLDLIQRIKSQQPAQKIIFLTAYSQREILCNALDTGAAAYYLKPIDLKRLMVEIMKVLEVNTEGMISRTHYPLTVQTGSMKLQHISIEFSGCPGNVRLIDLIVGRLPKPSHDRTVVSLRFDDKFGLYKDSLQLIANLVDDLARLLHLDPYDIDLSGEYFRNLNPRPLNAPGALRRCRILHND